MTIRNSRIRIAVLVLLVALLLSCFSGCGAQQTGAGAVSSQPAVSSSQSTVSSPLPVDGNDTDIEMQGVDSTCFSEIGYDADQELLLVRFRDSGSLYSYEPISQEEYDSFIGANSLGKYYNSYIKGNYECHRLE